MNRSFLPTLTLFLFGLLVLPSLLAAQGTDAPTVLIQTEWSRTDCNKIRLSDLPHVIKDGRVRGNLNIIADRVKNAMKSDDILRLHTMSTKDELEVTVVLKSGNGAAGLSRLIIAELYDVLLDSDVPTCILVFTHGEEWVETAPKTSVRKAGPTVLTTTISVLQSPPEKDAE